ncbi:hypothetical protein [Methanocella arvoryzae]|uniref:Uncharacterized protein n=1 Tax=Methanocella arvoryzae (strain DSM 22066 / NBRC 105507 / MRE50) TaxID=351160 RepID=Q0W604_METAR|nr:hypothetical protein [Methanocella arvoryzae]CAJ36189.1 conserved hypothetical protein [Methanocella arvoryzae MRE50]
MPNYRRTIVFATFLAAVFLTAGTAVASNVDADYESKGGYIVEPGTSYPWSFGILTISGSITQGNLNLHYKTVSGYYTNLPVDLDWGNSANSLRLNVYSPDKITFGPFYDNADGVIDGKISINIRNSNGIAQGTWKYEVYGHSVSGTQSYTI